MDVSTAFELISTFGFPIAASVVLAWFCFSMVHKYVDKTDKLLTYIQGESAKREDKLLNELAAARDVNERAIDTIAGYVAKLDIIQRDVSDIKSEISSALKR